MVKKIKLYSFGDVGIYNKYNPYYVYNIEFVPEVLYLIAKNKPFTISKKDIIKTLNIGENQLDNIINSIKGINFIEENGDKYKVNFPIFLESDLNSLDKYLANVGKNIGDIIVKKKSLLYDKITQLSSARHFTKERLLYHIICDDIFDGSAIDFFGKKNVFCISKNQPGNRDYLVTGYEDSQKIDEYSDKLLCSSNNFTSENFVFNSFGDSNGDRKDFYRIFRQIEQSIESATNFKEVNSCYMDIIYDKNKEIAKSCGELIIKVFKSKIKYWDLSLREEKLFKFLKSLDYLEADKESNFIKCKVPIFNKEDKKILDEILCIILNDIFDSVKNLFDDFEKNILELTSVNHKVDIKEIANELWHQVFGLTNEYLVKIGFVEDPKNIKGEGRYLRSFKIV